MAVSTELIEMILEYNRSLKQEQTTQTPETVQEQEVQQETQAPQPAQEKRKETKKTKEEKIAELETEIKIGLVKLKDDKKRDEVEGNFKKELIDIAENAYKKVYNIKTDRTAFRRAVSYLSNESTVDKWKKYYLSLLDQQETSPLEKTESEKPKKRKATLPLRKSREETHVPEKTEETAPQTPTPAQEPEWDEQKWEEAWKQKSREEKVKMLLEKHPKFNEIAQNSDRPLDQIYEEYIKYGIEGITSNEEKRKIMLEYSCEIYAQSIIKTLENYYAGVTEENEIKGLETFERMAQKVYSEYEKLKNDKINIPADLPQKIEERHAALMKLIKEKKQKLLRKVAEKEVVEKIIVKMEVLEEKVKKMEGAERNRKAKALHDFAIAASTLENYFTEQTAAKKLPEGFSEKAGGLITELIQKYKALQKVFGKKDTEELGKTVSEWRERLLNAITRLQQTR
jgi:hypothetical protein